MLQLFLLTLLWLATFSNVVAAPPMRVAVVYPQVAGGFETVFLSMLEGLKTTPGIEVTAYPVQDTTSQADFESWIASRRIQGVVSLGQRSIQHTQRLQATLPVVYGAVSVVPEGGRGISLSGDPEQFFSQLTTMAPRVKRVFTIYNDQNTGWLIPQAREAAERNGLELVAYQARDVREAVFHLRGMLNMIRNDVDGLWLQTDGVVSDKVALPIALEAAWERHLVVFSGNPFHVRRGALFSLHPDHVAMGRRLGDMLVQGMRGDTRSYALPSRSLLLTVNERTATHLGLGSNKARWREAFLVGQ